MDTLTVFAHYRHWTTADYVILSVSMALLIALKLGLPKLFRNADERVLNAASWSITAVFMLILVIAK